jgi:hypothetical protein
MLALVEPSTVPAQMNQPPEFWTTLSANILIFVIGGMLAVISSMAYQRKRDRSFQIAAFGFGLITVGNLVLVVYQIGVNRSYLLGGLELLRMQTISGMLVVVGLLSLLYSLYRY